jgi:ribosomal protein S30
MEALERIQQSLQPASNKHNTSPRVEAELTYQVPRVRFNKAPPKVQEPEPRLVVAWPKKQIEAQTRYDSYTTQPPTNIEIVLEIQHL